MAYRKERAIALLAGNGLALATSVQTLNADLSTTNILGFSFFAPIAFLGVLAAYIFLANADEGAVSSDKELLRNSAEYGSIAAFLAVRVLFAWPHLSMADGLVHSR